MMERRLFLLVLILALKDCCHCHLPTLAFAGFGSSTGKSKGTAKTNQKNNKKKKPPPPSPLSIIIEDLDTPQGRMDHIQSCIERASTSALTSDPHSLLLVDNFLGPQLVASLRTEAESIRPTMVPSQSTKWDDQLGQVVPYDKQGVFSTQIEGGPDGYAMTPRLVEYIVTLTKHLSLKLNDQLLSSPDCHLSSTQQTNKLAVCVGNGSKYDKHIDNLGGGTDQRKLTALLYLQPVGSHADNADDDSSDTIMDDPRGGYFRAYDVPEKDNMTCLAPQGDRLLLFWSDSLVHDVSPSFCVSPSDERWALTVWFLVDKGGVIRETSADIEQRHFGTG